MDKIKKESKTGGQFLVEPISMANVFSREDFTEEHNDIYNMVMEFDREKILAQKEEIEDYNPDLVKSLIKEMGTLGLLGIDVPEAYGGINLDKITTIIVAEALCLGSPIVATKVGGIPELVNSVRNKLNIQQKNIFDQWVKVVEPNEISIKNGIKSIISNKNSIKEYIKLVESFRHQFLWENKLKILFNRIKNFD